MKTGRAAGVRMTERKRDDAEGKEEGGIVDEESVNRFFVPPCI